MGTRGARSARRQVRQRIDPVRSLLIATAALCAAGSLVWTFLTGFAEPRIALAFGILIALGELARIALPGQREVSPIASASALGYTFLLTVGADPVAQGAAQVIAVTAVGLALGELPHVAVGRIPRWGDLARRLLVIGLVALAFRPLASVLGSPEPHWWLALTAMASIVMLSWLADSVIAAVLRAERLRTRFPVAFRDEVRAQFPISVATGASGILIALASSVMGLAALLVFTAPLIVTQVAFRRFAEIRLTYLQTVRALSRVTEVGGYVETGHSRRVSRLAHAVGCELGMRESELLELEYAALMHDIGQLSLRDPIPSGATVLAPPREQRRIAELGSAVIRETGVLDNVAEIVRRQCEPSAGEGETGPPPLASRIIKVANAFDDLVGESTDRDRIEAVLQRLRMDTDREYDPDVVAAVARVLDRPRSRW
ncbi:HD-GYP domain-containing protein [Marinactinospora thermotolerans]|uniref:Response regulator containing a CheY-like receiver domain and an HD-GYP domain n=1 Tax=Marinactinospora thermotolerans DSM 45154 TaxID=1122192 RepID=A0A1T4SCT3_9ACTN|nr:HD domain-containing phosphohydrolase [Marinactinospora thermotolerans]SKA26110.1 Response regulator containing a CheY-like receiver domain and an HD-GYP domain [Marinactinospora thermotolerans DSM 45154]